MIIAPQINVAPGINLNLGVQVAALSQAQQIIGQLGVNESNVDQSVDVNDSIFALI